MVCSCDPILAAAVVTAVAVLVTVAAVLYL
jgi:hypothetical protein